MSLSSVAPAPEGGGVERRGREGGREGGRGKERWRERGGGERGGGRERRVVIRA